MTIAKTPRHVGRSAQPRERAAPQLPRLPSRRIVLCGIGGAVLGLPLLESLGPDGRRSPFRASAAPAPTPHPIVFLRQANGVVQQAPNFDEPEMYWPRSTGPITTESLSTTDADRALSELAPYAEHLLMVKGTMFCDNSDITLRHPGGGNQVLTSAMVSEDLTGTASRALGESVDNYIARHFSQLGGEPLTLYTGPRDNYLEEVLSYRGPYDLRSAEDDPWTAYLRMVGGENTDELLSVRRQSINDLVRDQMTALMQRKELSSADRHKLELHFDNIRDFEVLAQRLSQEEEDAMRSLSGRGTLNSNRIQMGELHCNLIVLAFASDFARAATLQLGDGMDRTQFTINGVLLPSFHQISHRIYGDGMVGEAIEGAMEMHHEIDRIHLRIFRHLLDRLDQYGILESSIAVMTSDIGVGVSHTYNDIPWTIAGRGDGTLAQGKFIDVKGETFVTHNKLLNTLITATGLRREDGEPVDDFGDPTLERGLIPEMLA